MDILQAGRIDSPLGPLILCSSEEGLCAVLFADDRPPQAQVEEALRGPVRAAGGGSAHLEKAASWLERYFSGSVRNPGELTLAPRGTSYERRVWKTLLSIPYGEVRSYGEVARTAGGSPRAVGNACGRNPVAIVCPCHRVVAAGGRIGGFGGGLWRKEELLALEGATRLAGGARFPRSRGSA